MNLLKSLFSGRKKTKKNKRFDYKPLVEGLEYRVNPSTFMWVGSGNWAVTANWKVLVSGAWQAASFYPTSANGASNSIKFNSSYSNNNCTISANYNISNITSTGYTGNLTISAGNKLTINNSLLDTDSNWSGGTITLGSSASSLIIEGGVQFQWTGGNIITSGSGATGNIGVYGSTTVLDITAGGNSLGANLTNSGSVYVDPSSGNLSIGTGVTITNSAFSKFYVGVNQSGTGRAAGSGSNGGISCFSGTNSIFYNSGGDVYIDCSSGTVLMGIYYVNEMTPVVDVQGNTYISSNVLFNGSTEYGGSVDFKNDGGNVLLNNNESYLTCSSGYYQTDVIGVPIPEINLHFFPFGSETRFGANDGAISAPTVNIAGGNLIVDSDANDAVIYSTDFTNSGTVKVYCDYRNNDLAGFLTINSTSVTLDSGNFYISVSNELEGTVLINTTTFIWNNTNLKLGANNTNLGAFFVTCNGDSASATITGTNNVYLNLSGNNPSGEWYVGGVQIEGLEGLDTLDGTSNIVADYPDGWIGSPYGGDNYGYYYLNTKSATTVFSSAVVDNENANFYGSNWSSSSGGYDGSVNVAPAGYGANTASWTVDSLSTGSYNVEVTWTVLSGSATDATYEIFDGNQYLTSVTVDQAVSPSGGSVVSGTQFQSLGDFGCTSGSLTVLLSDNANGIVVADTVYFNSLSSTSLSMTWNSLTGPTSTMATGSTFTLSRDYIISGANAPNNFTIAYYASTNPYFDNVATYLGSETISGSGLNTGTYSGTSPSFSIPYAGTYYFFAQLDSTFVDPEDDNVDTIMMATSTPVVVTGTTLVDNNSAGFVSTTGWSLYPSGVTNVLNYASSGSGANTVYWVANNLTSGSYNVEVDWVADTDRATNATYAVYDNSTLLGLVVVNQQSSPTGGSTINGYTFQSLGYFDITSGTLTVELTDNANGVVIADAMLAIPESSSSVNIAMTSLTVSVTNIIVDTPFTINRDYSISGATAPSNFTITYWASLNSIFDNTAIYLGSETITSLSTGSYSGTSPSFSISEIGTYYLYAQVNNDFSITSNTDTVIADSTPIIVADNFIVDNGDTTFSTTGSGWNNYTGSGYNNNLIYTAGNTGSTATWSTSVSSGIYSVQISYVADTDRATNASYKVYDGATLLATVVINQKNIPTTSSVGGAGFQSLGNFDITSGTLNVVLDDTGANGVVIADASLVALPIIINTNSGFTTTGTWLPFGGVVYTAGNTGSTATWTTSVSSGSYDVQVDWIADTDRATNASYSVYDGSTLLATVSVNQKLDPSGGMDLEGNQFQSLGSYTISSGTLKVVLDDTGANGVVIADSMTYLS